MEQIIIRPLISEKSMNAAQSGKYTFKVALTTDKIAVKKSVEDQFKVEVVSVSMIRVKGKVKRGGKKRLKVKASDWKKAIVKLKNGQHIDVFDLKG